MLLFKTNSAKNLLINENMIKVVEDLKYNLADFVQEKINLQNIDETHKTQLLRLQSIEKNFDKSKKIIQIPLCRLVALLRPPF